MALQLQGLCTTSFSYSSSQFLATNLNSSHNCFRTASFKLAHHRMKNYRHICSESRSVPFSKRGIRRREAATERTSSGSHESTSTSPSTGGFQSLEMGNSQPNLGFKERENISQNPRPIHHRIPNFVGAVAAAQMLASLQAFATARCVKVNPDTPRKQVRVGGKKLLTPQPRLRTGFFSILDATMLPQGAIHEACTSAGVAMHGKPIGLDATLKVDLIVIGSVAVDPRTGARLRKGEGFAELEYGILRFMGAIDDSTLIVTSVHDKQLVDDIPVEKLLIHDVPVDVICTPTQIIHSNTTIPKPQGIYWDRLSPEKLGQIQILRELKKYIEKKTGQILPCGLSEKLPPTAERRSRRQGL